MVSLQPIHIWDYLGLERHKLARDMKHLFYLSWEDALWDLLKYKKMPMGSNILVPEFFCGDVEENIRGRGYHIVYYPVSKYLENGVNSFTECISKYNPRVIIIFHYVGIRNKLIDNKSWLKYVNQETILIEDSVHLLVDPIEIKFIKKNHFIIDSLRKVVPLQGSNLFGSAEDLDFSEPKIFQSLKYSLKVYWLWLKMLIFLNLSNTIKNIETSGKYADNANNLMMDGYDLIGDSNLPARGFFLFDQIQKFINYEKVGDIKKTQIEYYEEKLNKSLPVKIHYSNNDKTQMRAWPVVLQINRADRVLNFLRQRGLIVRFELNDSVWSKKQKIIYLPLGPHLNPQDLTDICSLVIKSLEGEK